MRATWKFFLTLTAMTAVSLPAAAQKMHKAGSSSTAVVTTGTAALGCRAPYPLRTMDDNLAEELRERLIRRGFGPALQSKDLAVAVVDLTDPEPVYAGINDTTMMYAASLPKITIVLAAVQAVKDKKLQWNEELRRRLGSAINKSSNRDATWGAHLVGSRYIERILRKPGYCLYGNGSGGLWLGRAYSSKSPSRRDPVAKVNHGATARQTARFYTLLSKGLLVDSQGSQRILSLMSSPFVGRKFVGGLKTRRGVKFLARKSGSWWHYHSDSALIQHGKRRYAVVALSKKVKNKDHRLYEIARAADNLITMRHRRLDMTAGNVVTF